MNPSTTAIILIGFQVDYFNTNGILHELLEDSAETRAVLGRTVSMLESLRDSPVTMISTPIIFSPDYSEVRQKDGLLLAIREAKAFKAGMPGAETVDELKAFGDRIQEIPGKRGFNAFTETELDRKLRDASIDHVVIAGAVTSICIDSTARAAYEMGMQVSILSDCTAARTNVEQKFFCTTIFPAYATVRTAHEVVASLSQETHE
ncbi:MAG: cysteine hydrolase family protein [Phycisphaerales bacterium]|nr:cysteine hydrolase family protein [Phycisphaerales bacterium]